MGRVQLPAAPQCSQSPERRVCSLRRASSQLVFPRHPPAPRQAPWSQSARLSLTDVDRASEWLQEQAALQAQAQPPKDGSFSLCSKGHPAAALHTAEVSHGLQFLSGKALETQRMVSVWWGWSGIGYCYKPSAEWSKSRKESSEESKETAWEEGPQGDSTGSGHSIAWGELGHPQQQSLAVSCFNYCSKAIEQLS